MAHHYQKRWVFTWNANEKKELPDKDKLKNLLDEVAREGVFQQEVGCKTARPHYQGRFVLKGSRLGKKRLLEIFSSIADTKNLTFDAERMYDSTEYCTKSKTRIAGPWYVGVDSYKTMNESMTITLREWQKQLLKQLTGQNASRLRDRKVIWIQDPKGGAGKSTFLKYLCFSEKRLSVKKLPMDKPDRLRMLVCKIVQKTNVDAFAFDFTKTFGEDTSLKNLFQIVEELKVGHVVSGMFGNPLEIGMTPPFVLIFTNEDICHYHQYLSADRWEPYAVKGNRLLKIVKIDPHDENTRYVELDQQENNIPSGENSGLEKDVKSSKDDTSNDLFFSTIADKSGN